jgi:low molecular weight protein-tyrosine phosphatase
VYRICFVCSGNICRSPIAEAVMRQVLHESGLADQVEVDSAGTGAWHVGEPADLRARRLLGERGYGGAAHRARQFDPAWFAERDLVVALDSGHARALRSLASTDGDRAKVRLLRSFDENAGDDLDVADPYYGDPRDFETVLDQVERGCRGVVAELLRSGVVAA